MRQAKLVLVALSLIGFFTISYSNLSEPYKSGSGSAFTGVDPSSIQEDSISDDEKEDDGASNSLKEYGPLTVCADRATYNSDEGTLTYYGDVFVMQIHNKHILCRKVKNPKKNYVYFTRNKKDTFKQLQEKWLGHVKEICADEKGCNFISGQKLTMKLDKDKKVQTLTMDTEGGEVSQFYNYPVDTNKDYKSSKELTKGPLDGEGKIVVYNVVNKSLELHKKAVINQNENQYKGDKIIYDMAHDLITIPGSKNRRSKIVLDGIQGKTKLDMGLAPIAGSNNKASAPMAS
jgi:lipopolysaccharide transport protein LptA